MKKILFLIFVFCLVLSLGFAAGTMAASQNWEQELNEALGKIKTAADEGEPQEALDEMIDEAVSSAMSAGGGGCQIMKMAVSSGINPYPVLVSIYSQGQVSLDDICMCATEQGVSAAVVAQAATDAKGPDGAPAYSRDELAQCQCLQAGLPYTAGDSPPPPPPPPPPVPPDSSSVP
jgi:hypothetical protein